MRRRALLFLLVALGFVATANPIAQSRRAALVAPAVPAGVSVERLGRIDTLVQKYVDQNRIAGAVTLVLKQGTPVHFKAYGLADREQKTPMTTDTIFRIASMSKAVTTVAIMTLVDNGDILLSDPVSKFLPAFEKTFVVAPPDAYAPGGRLGTVPAKRRTTIRDLLTHTAGISYGAGALEAEYTASGFDQWYFASMKEPLGAVIDTLAKLPFEAQPGERFVYGYNTDILGRVIEVVSGMSLDEYFRRHLFEPLRMTDSYFFLPKEKASRLATVYGVKADGTVERAPDRARVGQGEYVDGPRACFSGGAGLLSTANDYGRLLQMLLNGGQLDGVRVLSPAAVAAMTSNQVGSLYLNGQVGFGLGFEVVEHVGRAGRLTAVGAYGWGSAYYSTYVVSPSDDMVAIFFSQTIPATGLDVQEKFKSLAFQALEEPARR